MNKAELITWIATLPEDSPDLPRVNAIRRSGQVPPEEEPLCTLKEIGQAVRLCPTWLWKLRVREHVGERLAGSTRYRKSRVLAYLQSAECQERIRELHEERTAREQAKNQKGRDE